MATEPKTPDTKTIIIALETYEATLKRGINSHKIATVRDVYTTELRKVEKLLQEYRP